jgi:hypothetical protein
MKVSADVRAMIERRKKNYTLEAPFYTSEDIFALDMDAIFRQALDSGRRGAAVPEPGDYITVDFGNELDPDRARRRHADAGLPQRLPPPRRAPVRQPSRAWSATSSALITSGPTT